MTESATSSEIRKRPTTVQQLGDEIRAAAEAGERVRLEGSGSSGAGAAVEARPARVISTLRLNKVVEHAIADMTVIVQAGITLEVLQRQLAWSNQWLPVDPPAMGGRSPAMRTIGGLIATHSLGPMRFGMGDWRLLIMGMRWVDAGGTLISGGGRTVKNVAGYSTPRMMIGSRGRLGAIAEITLRTFARPVDEQCVLFFCDSAARAEALLAAIFLSPTTPAYLQATGGRTFAQNPLQLPVPGAAGGMIVAAGFLGRPEICAAQIAVLRSLPAVAGMESIAQNAAQAGRLRLWMTSQPGWGGDGSTSTSAVSFQLHLRSSEAVHATASVESATEADCRVWAVAEAGSGIVRGQIAGANAAGFVRNLAQRYPERLIVEGDASRKGEDAIYSRIKLALDPHHVFGD